MSPSIDLLWFSCRRKGKREGEFLFPPPLSPLAYLSSHLYRAIVAQPSTFHHAPCPVDDTIATASHPEEGEGHVPTSKDSGKEISRQQSWISILLTTSLPSLPFPSSFASVLPFSRVPSFQFPLIFPFVPCSIAQFFVPCFSLFILFFHVFSSSLHSPNFSYFTLHLSFPFQLPVLFLHSFSLFAASVEFLPCTSFFTSVPITTALSVSSTFSFFQIFHHLLLFPLVLSSFFAFFLFSFLLLTTALPLSVYLDAESPTLRSNHLFFFLALILAFNPSPDLSASFSAYAADPSTRCDRERKDEPDLDKRFLFPLPASLDKKMSGESVVEQRAADHPISRFEKEFFDRRKMNESSEEEEVRTTDAREEKHDSKP